MGLRYGRADPQCRPCTRLNHVQLSVDTIVSAAMDILDRYGLADMTMRRVASTLDVAPGALYWHIKNKQELISAIAERILDSTETVRAELAAATAATGTPTHPGDGAALFCAALRRALLTHRDGAELVVAAMTQPDSTIRSRLITALTEELVRAGLEETTAQSGAHALLHQVVGATTLEQAALQNAQLLTGEVASTSRSGTADTGVRLLLEALTRRDWVPPIPGSSARLWSHDDS